MKLILCVAIAALALPLVAADTTNRSKKLPVMPEGVRFADVSYLPEGRQEKADL